MKVKFKTKKKKKRNYLGKKEEKGRGGSANERAGRSKLCKWNDVESSGVEVVTQGDS